MQAAAGYLGEGFILEATRLGLGTCWIAGSFDKAGAADLVDLAPDEQVVAVTPLGYPTPRQAAASGCCGPWSRRRRALSVEKIAPGILDGGWPQWAVSAVQAARLAPSGANRQPWRFRLDGDSLVMGRAEKLYWTAPIDFGIARLHVELGAQHEGVKGTWTHAARARRRPVHARRLTARSRPAPSRQPRSPRQSYSSGRRSLR